MITNLHWTFVCSSNFLTTIPSQAQPWPPRGWWRGPGATLRWRAGACPPPPTSTWWSGSAAAAPAPSAPPTQTPASASSDTTTRSLRSAAGQKYFKSTLLVFQRFSNSGVLFKYFILNIHHPSLYLKSFFEN